jgi:hypothetical protein
MKRFPKEFYRENPFAPGIPNSIVIPEHYNLPDPLSERESLYFNYFENIDNHLESMSAAATIEQFSNWLQSLKARPKNLVIHDIERFDSNNDFSNYYIEFDNKYEVELLSDEVLIRTLNLPKPLQEVYKFGIIWVGGVPVQRSFCHPKNIQPANNIEELIDFINDQKDWVKNLGIPINELKTFYVDSGCWLMYDRNEIVYCGGYECGDFYRTTKNLEETIEMIFKTLNEYVVDPRFGFNPSIESFVN